MAKDEEDDLLPDKDAAKGFYAKYEPKEILGRGISSTVRRCIEKETGKEFAAKIIDLGAATEAGETNPLHMLEATRQEISILRQVMGHPYIIELQDVFESDAFVFLVFELCPKGELFDYLTSVVTLSEKKTRTIMRQIFEGVEYIHSKNIVHRDLKPENILLDDNHNVKITDFGFARQLKLNEKLSDLCGTPGYLAPETLKCNMFEGSPGYSKEVDIWACGVIMFTLLVGCPPFWHRKQMVMLRNIMEGKYSFTSPEWADISEDPKDLIRKCLVVDPAQRITVTEALRHPFFNQMVLLPEPSIDGHPTTYLLKAQSIRAVVDDSHPSIDHEQYSLKVVLNKVLSHTSKRRSTATATANISRNHSTDKLNNNLSNYPTTSPQQLQRSATTTLQPPPPTPKRKISHNQDRSAAYPYSYNYNQNYVNNIQLLGQQQTRHALDVQQQQQKVRDQQQQQQQQQYTYKNNHNLHHSHHYHHQQNSQIENCEADDELFYDNDVDDDDDDDEQQLRKQSRFNARKKFQFVILVVRAVIRIRRLRFTAEPLHVEEAIRDPYRVKVLRKVIDGCAFRVYGHWVKKGEGQNRAALFENTPRTELHTLYINNLSR